MPVVKKYLVEVTEFENPIPGIFTLGLVSNQKEFKYKPGQFLHLALDEYDPSKGWPESRCFSMQTSPAENFIKLTFAIKGNYTTRMVNELRNGKKIWIKLPYGELFSQDRSMHKCIFVAGGTGITPFLSLFTDNSFKKYKNPVFYFGAKSEQYNIYNNALELSKLINPTFSVKNVYENLQGALNIENIFNENNKFSTYFISGPPLMINAFKKFLLSKDFEENQIKTDEWE
ncbi:MAG: FAD-dependent oxidoreductase [Ignavibacteriaceae bacterium]